MLGMKWSHLTKAHLPALVPVPTSKCAHAYPLAFVPCVLGMSLLAGRSYRLTENG